MKYFSMFSGAKIFESAIEEVYPDAECVGCCEINKYAAAVGDYHYKHKNYGNAKTTDFRQFRGLDFLVAGFPCPDYSIAGDGQGIEGDSGSLVFEVERFLKEAQPRFFLLENVKNIVSHDNHATIAFIHDLLARHGYICQWVVLNSRNFGLAQNRERCFFIGNLRGECQPEILSLPESNRWDDAEGRGQRAQLGRVSRSLTAHGARNDYETESFIIVHSRQSRNGKGIGGKGHLSKIDQKSYCVDTANCQAIEIITKEFSKHAPQSERVYDVNGISPTLNSNGGGGGAQVGLYEVSGRIRRLTPLECERLQGMPDNWTQTGIMNGSFVNISDRQRYKMCGNAVSKPVIKELVKIFKF